MESYTPRPRGRNGAMHHSAPDLWSLQETSVEGREIAPARRSVLDRGIKVNRASSEREQIQHAQIQDLPPRSSERPRMFDDIPYIPPVAEEFDRRRYPMTEDEPQTTETRRRRRRDSPGWFDNSVISRDIEDATLGSNVMSCNISQGTDITVHLELEVVDDIASDLETFSRFCRLGNFAAAQHQFTEHLAHQETNPYVLTQYAQMLHDLGAFKTLESIESPKQTQFAEHQSLEHNWILIKNSGILRGVDAETTEISRIRCLTYLQNYLTTNNKCATTELQLLALSLSSFAYAARFDERLDLRIIRDIHKAMPYRALLREGQILECRDVLVSLICADPDMDILPALFGGKDAVELLDIVVKDWDTIAHDEATSIAILDVAQTLMLIPRQTIPEFGRLLSKTTKIMSSLLQHNPELVVTRQYLRWMVAKTAHEAHTNGGQRSYDSLKRDPGMFLVPNHVLYPPLYVPLAFEAPTLLEANQQTELIALLQTARESARSLGDYATEALCLQALTKQSKDPAAVFDDLADLQENIQGDIQACLQTYLSKYTICRDQTTQLALRQKLIDLRISENFPSVLLWARSMILRALSISADEARSYLTMASRIVFSSDNYIDMPGKYIEFMIAVRRADPHAQSATPDYATYEEVEKEYVRGPHRINSLGLGGQKYNDEYQAPYGEYRVVEVEPSLRGSAMPSPPASDTGHARRGSVKGNELAVMRERSERSDLEDRSKRPSVRWSYKDRVHPQIGYYSNEDPEGKRKSEENGEGKTQDETQEGLHKTQEGLEVQSKPEAPWDTIEESSEPTQTLRRSATVENVTDNENSENSQGKV